MARSKKIRNPLPCGCGAMGTPELNWNGTATIYKDIHVVHCALHAAAAELRDALIEATDVLSDSDWNGNKRATQALRKAKK